VQEVQKGLDFSNLWFIIKVSDFQAPDSEERKVIALNNWELFGKVRQTDVLFRRAMHMVVGQGDEQENTDKRHGHGHGKILHALDVSDGLSQKELAERLEIRPQSLTEALLRLEQEGYISRTRSAKDKREQFVQITPQGRERAHQVYEVRRQALDLLFSGLEEAEKEQLNALLEKLIERFKEEEEKQDV